MNTQTEPKCSFVNVPNWDDLQFYADTYMSAGFEVKIVRPHGIMFERGEHTIYLSVKP